MSTIATLPIVTSPHSFSRSADFQSAPNLCTFSAEWFSEQTGLGEEVEIETEDDRIIIRPAAYPRQGWDKAFEDMSKNADDELLDEDLTGQETWDREEWQW